MSKGGMSAMLKNRMIATREASELEVGNAAYETLFQAPTEPTKPKICKLPMNKLRSFFTADIGFKPYSPAKLKAFCQQLQEEGLLVRIIVRRIPHSDRYEILAGHNRTAAARLAGWAKISAEIVVADDARAISIATLTNLLQRQDLSVIERGKAYKALLEAKNRNGQHNAAKETFGDNRQRYNARAIVAEFFGVTEYEIRKAVKLTQLIPELQSILEESPKKLNLACANLIADYDPESQHAFVEMCGIEGYQINKATVQHIIRKCPPPMADRQLIFAAWREARAEAEKRLSAPPKKISFDRKKFAPYLDKLGGDQEIEALFLEFLQERVR